jgi:hypothetical protein
MKFWFLPMNSKTKKMKNTNLLFTAIAGMLFGFSEMKAQFANVQVIHNCADAAADSVDIYINGTKALDNFAFRTATSFIPVPAAIQVFIAVAPKTSTSVTQAIYTSPGLFLVANTSYVIIADGIVSSNGYSPTQPFDLKIYQPAQTTASAGFTKLLVHHGCTDAPAVDVVIPDFNFSNIADNITYGNYNTLYVLAPSVNNVNLQVRTSSNNSVAVEYVAPLTAIDQLGVTVFASGFLNPANNSNGPAFGLFAALPNGTVVPFATTTISSARLQVLHNSADAAASTVDVYANGTLLLDNFAFRTATPFIDVAANTPILIDVAPSNSTSSAQSIYNTTINLPGNTKAIAVAQGIVSASGYSPNIPFGIAAFTNGKEDGTSGTNTDVLVIHGSTDAPAVDVDANGTSPNLISNLAYNNFQGYASVPTADYTLNVKPAGSSAIVASYTAPLATLAQQGKALAVVASGFLTPASNSNGPAFGLYAVLPSGGPFIQLPIATGLVDIKNSNFNIYPNPMNATNGLNIESKTNEVINYTITDLSGKNIAAAKINLQVGSNAIKVNSDLNKGLYFLNIKSEKASYATKLVVE